MTNENEPITTAGRGVLDAHQAARLLGAHVETVRRMARRAELPAYKMGRDWRFKEIALQEWMETHHLRCEKRRVLVVDDELSVRDLVQRTLTRGGYDVTAAVDGETALLLIAQKRPELLILDLMMPELDGADILARLRANESSEDWIPVIVLTSFPGSEIMERAMAYAPFTVLTKPVMVDKLEAAVREKLGHAR